MEILCVKCQGAGNMTGHVFFKASFLANKNWYILNLPLIIFCILLCTFKIERETKKTFYHFKLLVFSKTCLIS